MKFCAVCEKPLDFLEFLDGELCAACRQKQNTAAQPADPGLDIETLLDATLSFTGDKVELRSPEGWVLWTAGAGRQQRLHSILSGAQKILEIRRKRSKNKP